MGILQFVNTYVYKAIFDNEASDELLSLWCHFSSPYDANMTGPMRQMKDAIKQKCC